MTDAERSADTLLQIADETFQQRDYQTALRLYEEVVDAAREEFNRPVEVEGLSQMARMNLLLGRADEGRKWLAEAGSRASDSDCMGWSRYLGVKGRFEWRSNDLKTASETFIRMYDYCNLHSLWSRAVDAANMMALVSESSEDQIEWGRKGIAIAEAREADNWLGPLWNNLAGTYFDAGQYEKALECYLTAREYHYRFSEERPRMVADYHVGMTYRFLGKYEEAVSRLEPVLAWTKQTGDHDLAGQAAEDLGEAEIGLGTRERGVELLRLALDEYRAAGYDVTRPGILKDISDRIEKLTGQ